MPFEGSLLAAHFGFSGPVALDLSRHFASDDPASRRVTCNFAPAETPESLLEDWFVRIEREPMRAVKRHLNRWMPDRLAHELAWEAEIDPARPLSQASKPRRALLLELMTARDMGITGTLG